MQTVLILPQTKNMRLNVCKCCGKKLKAGVHNRCIGPVCKKKIELIKKQYESRIDRIAKEYVEREYFINS